MRYFLIFLLFFTLKGTLYAQDDPFFVEEYSFVDLSKNEFVLYDAQEPYARLYKKLTSIGLTGTGKVSIVHIGDSHIQADFLSGNIRGRLQTFFVGSQSGRGFVFPYKVAKTNNPMNYKVVSKGDWQNCRNVQANLSCKLGLSGIAVTTTDSMAQISINIADAKLPGYDFDRLMVFHEFGENQYSPKILAANNTIPFPDKGYTLFEFNDSREQVTIQLSKSDKQNEFKLYSVNFDSNDSGIVYHTVGVNGAQYESYLKCDYYIPHLSALKPDWVLISLGTNDVYTDEFNVEKFSTKVDCLIVKTRIAAPNAAILLITPGDHYIKRSYDNPNIYAACKVLYEKAEKYHLGVWDFYSVMGGANSIDFWRFTGLAHTDFLHFTQKGYNYQGQLFFNAFIKSYDQYLTKEFMPGK